MVESFNLQILESIKLENIITIEYNQESLKANFEILVQYLRGLGQGMNQLTKENIVLKSENVTLKEKQNSQQNDIDKQQNELETQKSELNKLKDVQELQDKKIAQNKSEIDKLWDALNKLKQELADLNNRLGLLEQRVGGLEQQLKEIQKILEQLKNELEQIKILGSSSSGSKSDGSIDQSAIQKLLKEIQKIREEYVTKIEFGVKCQHYDDEDKKIWDVLNSLKSKLDDLSKEFENLGNNVTQINVNVKEVTQSLNTKVENKVFDKEIQNLKLLISKMGGQGTSNGKDVQIIQGGLGEAELQMLRDMDQKIDNLRSELEKLRKDHEEHKGQYQKNKTVTDKRLTDLENLIKSAFSKEDYERLLQEVKSMKEELESTTFLSKDNDKKIKELRRILDYLLEKIKDGIPTGEGGIGEDIVDEKIRKCKEDLRILIIALREEVEKRVILDDLWKSEALILEKLDEVAGALLKKLADKGDTKKALIYLEKKGGKGDDDALITKKPLFWSCISCDKGLDQYKGSLGDYKHWAVFPPKETTPERMGRFGKGYKTMLERSKLKEERLRQDQNMQLNENFPSIAGKTPGLNQNYDNR